MKNKLMMKVGAVFLAACVTFSTLPTTTFATSGGQQTTQVSDNTSTIDSTNSTDSAGKTDITDSTDSTEDTNTTETTDGTADADTTEISDDTADADTTETIDGTEDTDTTETAEDTDRSNMTDTTETGNGTDNTNTTDTTDTTDSSDITNETDSTNNTEIKESEAEDETEDTVKDENQQDENAIERHMGYNGVDDLKIPSLYDGTYIPNNMGTLPSSYDSRAYGYITPVRDQGDWGSCWAFSAIAMAEANLVKKGLANNALDLSELHLAYFFYHTVADPLGNTTGDKNTALTDNYLDQGGNSAFTTFALASWIGAADESKAPYENATSASYALNSSLAFADDYHMQNAYWINMTDVAELKNMIMRYGAVSTSYYSDQIFNQTTTYYNGATKAYYYDGSYASNHAILIVGWDDSFSRTNFNAAHRPSLNGAWLIKNSWGTDFGNSGYFWISYEDGALIDADYSQAFVFDFESADNYDHNYQYDGSSAIGYEAVYNGGSIANVFTAKANLNGGAENINAVSFALYNANVDYSIQIYTNLSNSQDPTSGTAMLTTPKKGRTSYAGYYTIALDYGIEVAEGTTFSVVVSLTRSASSYVIYSCDDSYINADWIQFTNACKAGQSFSKVSTRASWSDLSSAGLTARIKAFTTNTTLTQPTAITLSKSSLTLKAGGTASLKATTTPVALANSKITWKSSNQSVATVDSNGKVTAKGIGTATITASTQNGLSATCKITGKIGKIANLKATQTTKQIKLSWTKQSGVSGYEIYRYNSSKKKYEKIATNTKASKNTYTDKSRAVGTTYQYKVRAYVKEKKKNTYGSYSAVLKTSTKTTSPSLAGTAQSKKAKLTWRKVNGATGYEIYMSTKKSSGYSLIKTIKKGKTVTYTKKGLTKNKKYYFKIRTYKSVGKTKIYSGYSKVITVKAK